MRNYLCLILIKVLILSVNALNAQSVGISETMIQPHSSSIFEVRSENKGILIPRVALLSNTDIVTIEDPAESLLVYNTSTTVDLEPGYYYWDGVVWKPLGASAETEDAWSLTGNAGTNPTDNFLGTTDNEIFDIRTNSERAVRILAENTSGGLSDNGRVDILNRLRIGKDGDSGNTLSGSLLVGYGAPDIYTGGISLYSSMTTGDHSFQGGIRMHNATTGTSDRGALISLKGSNLSIASIGDNIDDNILFENPNGTERMRIANNGNIGIGTTNPEEKLHISSENETGIDWNLVVQNTNNSSSTEYGTGIKLKNSSFEGDEATKWFGLAAVAGTEWSNRTDLVFYSNSNSSGGPFDNPTERVRITGNGNVGIGTENPEQKLHLKGTALNILLENPNGNTFNINSTNGGDFRIYRSGGTNIPFTIKGSDLSEHIGINNPDPHSELDIIGNIVVDGRISVNSGTNPAFAIQLPNIASDGTGRGRAHTWTTYSDTRIKSDRKEIAYGIKDVLKIEPMAYFQHNSSYTDEGKLKIESSGEYTFGIIAQELYEIIPEIVSKPELESELWGIDYSKLTPVLVKSIQEQQAEIETLRNELEELKQLVNSLVK